ncbi:hypothetical protein FK514_28475, partial [Klebsiella pneumoniae]|nr:hypothetical protein [Klebsiella pneumoniae]
MEIQQIRQRINPGTTTNRSGSGFPYLECRQLRAGAEERLRIALLNVDYVTSFELPFRLLLVRAPQLIADVLGLPSRKALNVR